MSKRPTKVRGKRPLSQEQRDRTIADLSKIITAIYGPRCEENEAGCMCCTAWAIFDVVGKLTESSLWDDDK